MGIFSCCFKNEVEQVTLPIEEVETFEKELIINRKVTSATSKESKDSGCPTESITSEPEHTIQHKGDGDQGVYQAESDLEEEEEEDEPMITEHSEVETVAAIVNETRPITPELVLTGVKVDSGFSSCRLYYQNSQIRPFTNDSVRKIQTKAVLAELSALPTINHTIQSPSGAVAYTYGDQAPIKLAPSRLPPIVRKPNLDRNAIEQNLQKALYNKEKQLQGVRDKLSQREQRRRNVLERKRANMSLNLDQRENDEEDEEKPIRRRHTDDELIAPSSMDL